MTTTTLARKLLLSLLGALGGLALLTAPVQAASVQAAETSYSYPRVLEGPATLFPVDGESDDLDLNQPLLVGDRISVPTSSRVELVLSDRSLVRFAGDGELSFDSLAYSADTEDTATRLRMPAGQLQLVVPDDVLGASLPQIDTLNATIYVHREGSFRVTASDGYTELVVREGLAELVTERSSVLVHAGELGFAEGGSSPRIGTQLAAGPDGLEEWGERLTAEAARAAAPYVEEPLRYAAAPLADSGAWVSYEGRWGWRPRVDVAWRPYSHGYWRHTPIGLTWVSSEPWGHVTHHYGSWDYRPGHGWIWYPGYAYAPARVYWYWGPDYVGWCPSGYYGHHYGGPRSGVSLSFGTYGWAGGSWSSFHFWNFTTTVDFGHRPRGRHHHHRRYDSGLQWSHRKPHLDRGIITTDPRVGRGDGRDVFARLRDDAQRRRQETGRDLPDVSDFVARKPLRSDVADAVLRQKPRSDGRDDGGWATGRARLPITRVAANENDRPATARSAAASKPAVGEAWRERSRTTRVQTDTGKPAARESVTRESVARERATREPVPNDRDSRRSYDDRSTDRREAVPSTRSRQEPATVKPEHSTERPSRIDPSRQATPPRERSTDRPAARPESWSRSEKPQAAPPSRPERVETPRPTSRTERPERVETPRPPSRSDDRARAPQPTRERTWTAPERPSRAPERAPQAREPQSRPPQAAPRASAPRASRPERTPTASSSSDTSRRQNTARSESPSPSRPSASDQSRARSSQDRGQDRGQTARGQSSRSSQSKDQPSRSQSSRSQSKGSDKGNKRGN